MTGVEMTEGACLGAVYDPDSRRPRGNGQAPKSGKGERQLADRVADRRFPPLGAGLLGL
jgi:hypothetical protein